MKKTNKELFSIIIPCYNSEDYLDRLLKCLKKQTYKNLEIILINDGSTDKTLDMMNKFKKEVKYKVIIKTQENKGLGGAINTGLKLVTGDYFSYINSDDMITEDYVESFIKLFNSKENVNVIQRNGYLVPEDEVDQIGKKEFNMINDWNTNPFEKHLFLNMILEVNYNFTYVAIRTKAFDKVVKDRDIYESRDGQNYQILLPMFYNYESDYINTPGIYFVTRSTSLSRNYKNEKPGRLYEMYDEYKKIILTTLKKMKLDNYDYLEELVNQKYIVKKLEYAKEMNLKDDIDYYEKEYKTKVMKNNIYEQEIKKVREKYPLVSIIVPVYNGSNYMREAIDSALKQDYPNIEIIVVNDGSKDDGKTEEIALSYGDKITYYKKENGGVSTALNFGISKMKGAYFSWLSHDDRYYENKISTQMYYLINNNLLNKKVITYTDYDVINEKSKVIGETSFGVYRPNDKPELALLRGLISGTALLIPKDAFDECGVFDTKYRCVQDYLLFFDFMKKYRYIFIPKITNSTRVHAGQVTNVNPKVIEENNFLWIKFQEETPDETKIRLMHSIYDFYVRMERYLRINMGNSKNDYVEAKKHALNKAEEIKKSATKKMNKIYKDNKEEDIYSCLYNYYKKCHKFRKIKDRKVKEVNQELLDQIQLIINDMGLYNTIDYLYEKTNDKHIKKMTDKMRICIKCHYRYYFNYKNKFDKFITLCRGYGFIGISKHIIIRICDKLRLWRIIRIFIPQKKYD
ncbi:MAG: glycosyltransferase family 2 protein [Bacilli bacterium]|nr:glycosyltransferase family 2 protein [Bacilli bacterium]